MASHKFGIQRTPKFGSGGSGGVSAKRPLVDLSAFPILTEDVGYSPSPIARAGGGMGAVPSLGSGGGLGQTALKAVADVLGWKVKAGDVGGFTGALTQAFTLTEVEGHVQATWVPRTYAVQSDLSGGISGAQASLYSRAKYTLDQALPLLAGLQALNPAADPEDLEALRAVVNSQMVQLVGELPYAGGPRVSRVTQYFSLLIKFGAQEEKRRNLIQYQAIREHGGNRTHDISNKENDPEYQQLMQLLSDDPERSALAPMVGNEQ